MSTQHAINRSELVDQLARKLAQTPEDTDYAVKVILQEITQALANQSRVEIRQFGHFETRTYPAQTRLNPKTGEPVAVDARKNVHFTAGKRLKARVDQTNT